MERLLISGTSPNKYTAFLSNDVFDPTLEKSYWDSSYYEQYLQSYNDYVGNLSSLELSLFKIYEYDGVNISDTDYATFSPNRIVVLSIFAVIFVVGLIGNALVIYTVSRYVTMRRVTYLYLLNLSAADLMYLLVCLPALSISYALVDWRFGRFFCKLQNYVMSVSMSVSVLTIVSTGLDRYVAVVYPLRARTYRTVNRTVAVIILTWILSLTAMAPRTMIFDEKSVWHITGKVTLCSRVQTDIVLQVDTTLNFIFLYLLPLLVLCSCHSRIGHKLWSGKRPGNAPAYSGQMRMLLVRHKRRIAKIIFAVTIIFAIGWLPIHVYHLVEDFDKGKILFGKFVDRGMVALFFSFGANSLNPIIYCMFSSNFRQHFTRALRCWKSTMPASANDEDLVYLRNSVATPRQPLALLPRPASLLEDSVSYLGTDSVYLGQPKNSISINIPSLQPLLNRQSDARSCCTEFASMSSPMSGKGDVATENNSFMLAPGTPCEIAEDQNPVLPRQFHATLESEIISFGLSLNNLQISGCVSSKSPIFRRAKSCPKIERSCSFDCCRFVNEMLTTSQSFQGHIASLCIPGVPPTTTGYRQSSSSNTGGAQSPIEGSSHCNLKDTQETLACERQPASVYSSNTWPSQHNEKTGTAATHTLNPFVEYSLKMAHTSVSNLADTSDTSPSDNKHPRNLKPLTASTSKLPQCAIVSRFTKGVTLLPTAESSTDMGTVASKSISNQLLLPGSIYHSAVQGCTSTEIQYVGGKYMTRMITRETSASNLTPVD